jgi:hypothetical protein
VTADTPRRFAATFRDRRVFSACIPLTATFICEGRPACITRPMGMWRLRCLLQLVSLSNEAVSMMGFIAATCIVLFFTNYFSWGRLLAIFCYRNTIAGVCKLGKCTYCL